MVLTRVMTGGDVVKSGTRFQNVSVSTHWSEARRTVVLKLGGANAAGSRGWVPPAPR